MCIWPTVDIHIFGQANDSESTTFRIILISVDKLHFQSSTTFRIKFLNGETAYTNVDVIEPENIATARQFGLSKYSKSHFDKKKTKNNWRFGYVLVFRLNI